MKRICQIAVALLASILVFSCEKDDTNNDTQQEASALNLETSKGIKKGFANYTDLASKNDDNYNLLNLFNQNDDCFIFEYPATLSINNGQKNVEVTNDDELSSILFGNDVKSYSQLYPKNITLKDGTEKVLKSEEDFKSMLKNCSLKKETKEECKDCQTNCFKIIFPMEVNLPNGNTKLINNNNEGVALIKSLQEPEFFTPVFPMKIISKNTPIVVNNGKELHQLFNECYN
ncbi:hypothetical protein [Aquimarina agarilytica]|uniref:hypothetical protein n=1 Tax=Aquimarina agarilytica TaxID=1087449 RepID=UPI0002896EA8|nr:hypothetical protein [Aquimarina agarilytica]